MFGCFHRKGHGHFRRHTGNAKNNNAVGRLFPNQNHSENHHGFDKLVGTSKHCAKLVVATNPVYIYDMFANIRIEKSLYQLKCFVLLE